MPTITREQALELWSAGETERADMEKRERYYNGDHAILGATECYGDGVEKSQQVTNWMAYIVNRYRGSISSYQITLDAGNDKEAKDTQGAVLDEFALLAKNMNLDAVDDENLRNALTQGFGVEVHGFDSASESIIIDYYPPREWVFPSDTSGNVIAAIRKVVLEKGAIHEGEFLEKPLDVIAVYDDTSITTYTKKKDPEKKDPDGWDEGTATPHHYGQIPVIQWWCGGSVLSDAIMVQNDKYNTIDSQAADAVAREIDSLLVVAGLDPNWVKDHMTEIKELRSLPLDDKGSASILARKMDIDRFESSLARVRSQIHIMGEVPDVDGIVGASGATSGIALKLMFTPMKERVESMLPHIKQGIRQRIDLINARFRKLGKPELTGYQLNIAFLMPVNRIEEWQNIGQLAGIVSHRTQLAMLTDIEYPEAELELLQQESPGRAEPAEGDIVATIEQRTADRDVGAVALEDKVGEMIDTISDAVTSRVLTSGVIPKAPKA